VCFVIVSCVAVSAPFPDGMMAESPFHVVSLEKSAAGRMTKEDGLTLSAVGLSGTSFPGIAPMHHHLVSTAHSRKP